MNGGGRGPDAMEVVGRGRELGVAHEFLMDPRDGAAVLEIEGPAGIGKSTIWREVLDGLPQQTLRLTARPTEAEQNLAFSLLVDIVAELPDELIDELDAVRRAALKNAIALEATATIRRPDDLALRLAVTDLFRRAADQHRLIIAIDDVQWTDLESARVLAFALRRLHDAAITLVFARRVPSDSKERPLDPTGLAYARARTLNLEPLTLGAISHLIRVQLGIQLTRPNLVRLYDASGGVPFFALEIARNFDRLAAGSEGRPLPLPERLKDVVGDTVDRLADDVRIALAALAATSTRSVRVLSAAFGQSIGHDLAAAAEAGIVILSGDNVEFVHPLWASHAYSSVTTARRRHIHRKLADSASGVEDRARHLALAAVGPDEEVAAALDVGVKDAAYRGAVLTATDLADLAVTLTPHEYHDRLLDRTLEAGIQHIYAGNITTATKRLEKVIQEAPSGAIRAKAVVELAEFLEVDDMVVRLKGALAEPDLDETTRARVLTKWSTGMLLSGNVDAALHTVVDALRSAERSQDPNALATAISHAAVVEIVSGTSLGLDLEDLAATLNDHLLGLTAYNHPLLWLGMRCMFRDDLDGAASRVVQAERYRERVGDEGSRSGLQMHMAELACRHGDFPRALELAYESVDGAREQGFDQGVGASLYCCAVAEAMGGDPGVAISLAAEGLAAGRRAGDRMFPMLNLWALGLANLALSDREAAFRHLWELWELYQASGYAGVGLIRFHPDLVEAAIAVGDSEIAEEVASHLVAKAEEQSHPWGTAAGRRCTGHVRVAAGDIDRGLIDLRQTVDLHRDLRQPFELARTLMAFGTALRRAKRKKDGRDALTEAKGLFRRMGAGHWENLVDRELARIGGRAPAPLALTETEERVARLVAAGRSNREVAAELFMSVKTVEANLSRVYRKLGLRSRTELAAAFLKERDS